MFRETHVLENLNDFSVNNPLHSFSTQFNIRFKLLKFYKFYRNRKNPKNLTRNNINEIDTYIIIYKKPVPNPG